MTNYTGPIPVILNVPDNGRLGAPKRQISVSMSELGPHLDGARDRRNAGSVPHLPQVGLSARGSQKSSRIASVAHLADRTASSMANLASSLAQAVHPSMQKSPSRENGSLVAASEPNSRFSTPRGSRANSRASALIHLRPDGRYSQPPIEPETSV